MLSILIRLVCHPVIYLFTFDHTEQFFDLKFCSYWKLLNSKGIKVHVANLIFLTKQIMQLLSADFAPLKA